MLMATKMTQLDEVVFGSDIPCHWTLRMMNK